MSRTPETVLTPKQQEWLSHVRRCRRSGSTVTEYARHHGISAPQLYTWISRLRRLGALEEARPQQPARRKSRPAPAAVQFSPVRIEGTAESSPMRIRFANGIVLELAGAHAPDAVLLATLAALP